MESARALGTGKETTVKLVSAEILFKQLVTVFLE